MSAAGGSAADLPVVPLRHPWTAAGAALSALVAAAAAWSVATNPAFGWPVVARYLFDPQILAGLARTGELTLLAMVKVCFKRHT